MDEFGRVDYDKLCKLQNDLEACEKLEGLSKQELRAREQALGQEPTAAAKGPSREVNV